MVVVVIVAVCTHSDRAVKPHSVHSMVTVRYHAGGVSRRGRPLRPGRRVDTWRSVKESPAASIPSRGRPPLSRRASRLQHNLQDHEESLEPAVGVSPAASPVADDEEVQAGPSNAESDDAGYEHEQQQTQEPVDLLAAAAATLAGCKKDKQGLLPMWGHKGRRSQGHDVSPLSEEAEFEAARAVAGSGVRVQGEQSKTETHAESGGRNLRPRSARRRPRSS